MHKLLCLDPSLRDVPRTQAISFIRSSCLCVFCLYFGHTFLYAEEALRIIVLSESVSKLAESSCFICNCLAWDRDGKCNKQGTWQSTLYRMAQKVVYAQNINIPYYGYKSFWDTLYTTIKGEKRRNLNKTGVHKVFAAPCVYTINF